MKKHTNFGDEIYPKWPSRDDDKFAVIAFAVILVVALSIIFVVHPNIINWIDKIIYE